MLNVLLFCNSYEDDWNDDMLARFEDIRDLLFLLVLLLLLHLLLLDLLLLYINL